MNNHELEFGDYVNIKQIRYGSNEQYLHKVIGTSLSNCYVDVPVQSPAKETLHDEVVPVVSCICCGVKELLRYRLSDATFKFMKKGDFNVLNEMSKRDMDIKMTSNLIAADKIKQGGKITFGVDGETFNDIAFGMLNDNPKYFCAMYIINIEQFNQIKNS